MYDLDKEAIREGFNKDTKPILKTCKTEKCDKNSDCLCVCVCVFR